MRHNFATHTIHNIYGNLMPPEGMRHDEYLSKVHPDDRGSMLQYSAECDHLTSTLVNAVSYHLVIGVIGRSQIIQGPVFISLFDPQVEDIETIVHIEVMPHVFHVEGIESCLCLP